MADIGLKINVLREQAKISQTTLAHDLGMSQTTLCNIESGITKAVDFILVDKLCRYFNKSFDYFLDTTSVHNAENNNGGIVGHNYGTINNNFPESILEQVKLLVEENLILKKQNSKLREDLRGHKA